MLLCIFLVSNLLFLSNGANILSVLPSSSKSHFIYPNSLLLELASSGHTVTVVSQFPLAKSTENYTSVDVTQLKREFESRVNSMLTKESKHMNMFSKFKFLYENTMHMTNLTLQHPEMKRLMKSDQKFDLIVLDLFLTDALLGLSTIFDCPVVALSSNGPHTWFNDVLGLPRPASSVPHMFTDFTERANLGRRLENEFFYYLEKLLLNFYHFPLQEQLFNEVFANFTTKTFNEVRKSSVAITLVNSHFSVSFPKPFLPNTVEVAGMQINEDVMMPLPDDIREFIENSKDGVIYFSLGNSMKASMMDANKKRDLIEALSRLKQNTIWQHGESLEVDSRKIMVRKWLPQHEILGHMNTKLFITQAGLWSCIEAINFAKNVIAVPIHGYQPLNAKKLASSKYGIRLDYLNFTGESLTWAVNEILSNTEYSKSIEEASKHFRDKPSTAIETGKFWIEHVLRNGINRSHLQLNFIELHNIDVYIIILIIILLTISINFFMLKMLALACHKKLAARSSKTKTT